MSTMAFSAIHMYLQKSGLDKSSHDSRDEYDYYYGVTVHLAHQPPHHSYAPCAGGGGGQEKGKETLKLVLKLVF